VAAGGPRYDYRQIDPAPDSDGGEPGGNIRVSFLFRTDVRGLRFIDRPGGDATTATEPVAGRRGARLTLSPGRVDPTNPVFENSRKPLAGEFRYRGRPLFVVGNHFNSKGGDDPVLGRFQEPRRSSEVQRRGQAEVLNRFVRRILSLDARARVVVLGDLNDFDFSETLRVVERGTTPRSRELVNLWRLLPRRERYSYIFQGNAQTLDHILVSPFLLRRGRPDFEPVHINTEFADQISDHDPPIVRFRLP
jgi:predicted extracellular nuclease